MRNTPLGRRLGAIIYDGLLVIALQLLGTVPFVAMEGGGLVEPGTLAHQLTVLVIAWLFFCGFWTRAGRTLGMQSWRLQLEKPDGGRPGLGAATIRFFAAIVSWLPMGLGFLWQLWDKDNLTWHDRLSGTQIRYYPKEDSG
jgi:uncharacterized RDD family membrane protein YckC